MSDYSSITLSHLSAEFLASWQRLWDSSPLAHPFNSLQWFTSCQAAFAYPQIKILAVYKNGSLEAVVPLVKTTYRKIPCWAFPGQDHQTKSTLLAKELNPQLISHLASTLTSLGNLHLSCLPAAILPYLPADSHLNIQAVPPSPYLDLQPDPFAHLAPKKKRYLDRIIADPHNHLSFVFHDTQLESHLQTVFNIEGQSQKRLDRKDLFSRLSNRKLFVNLVQNFPHQVMIGFTCQGHLPIASELGITSRGCFHSLHSAYLPQYARLYPGKLLIYKLIEHLAATGAVHLDFGPGVYLHKTDFTPYTTAQYDLFYSPSTLVTWGWSALHTLQSTIIARPRLYAAMRRLTRS